MEELSQSQILLFFTTEPDKVTRRMLRFREAFMERGANFEFAIISFIPNAHTSVETKMYGGVEIVHYVYGPDAIETLGYPVKGSKRPFKLIPGNCDLVTLLFWKSHPQYQYLWVMEDDVEYSGDPRILFCDLVNKEGDLLATHVTKFFEEWTYARNFRYPGAELSAIDLWLTFFPFYRVSRSSLELINHYYLAGWDGHHEMTWPTILKMCDRNIVDIGGQGAYVLEENLNKHYVGLPGNPFEKHGSFGTMQIRLRAGKEKNVLWHPIKRPKAWLRQKTKRTISIAKWQYSRLSSMLSK